MGPLVLYWESRLRKPLDDLTGLRASIEFLFEFYCLNSLRELWFTFDFDIVPPLVFWNLLFFFSSIAYLFYFPVVNSSHRSFAFVRKLLYKLFLSSSGPGYINSKWPHRFFSYSNRSYSFSCLILAFSSGSILLCLPVRIRAFMFFFCSLTIFFLFSHERLSSLNVSVSTVFFIL